MGHPWDEHAAWWQAGFTDGADAEYVEQILPLVATHLAPDSFVLDVGCGEGQIARLASDSLGCTAVGVDPSTAQLAEAVRRGGAPRYLRGSVTELAVASGSVGCVVACLVLEHVDDLDTALSEIARVLQPGGRLLVLLNHPLVQTPDSGWIDDHTVDPPEQYWQLGPYLPEAEISEQVDNGVFITFHHRPLSRYLNAAIERGLALAEMVEPSPPPGFLAGAPQYAAAAGVPRLLFLRFTRT